MNRPFLRELAKRAGHSVHQRSSHGLGPAYDWSPKHTMLSSHFKTEEAAWKDVEEMMQRKMEEAEKLIRLSQEIIREDPLDDPLPAELQPVPGVYSPEQGR